MDINKYNYVVAPQLTGDIIIDVNNFLLRNNKGKTLKHVQEVAKTSISIADKYALDRNVCEIAGYMHDISAVIRPTDMLNYVQDYGLYIDEAEKKYPFLLHQRIACEIAKKYFGITNEAILSAIGCHTTLKSNPSDYDMALFIADKLSWDQEGEPPFYQEVLDNLSISLEKACLCYMDYVINNGMVLFPHRWLLESKDYLDRIVSSKK